MVVLIINKIDFSHINTQLLEDLFLLLMNLIIEFVIRLNEKYLLDVNHSAVLCARNFWNRQNDAIEKHKQ